MGEKLRKKVWKKPRREMLAEIGAGIICAALIFAAGWYGSRDLMSIPTAVVASVFPFIFVFDDDRLDAWCWIVGLIVMLGIAWWICIHNTHPLLFAAIAPGIV